MKRRKRRGGGGADRLFLTRSSGGEMWPRQSPLWSKGPWLESFPFFLSMTNCCYLRERRRFISRNRSCLTRRCWRKSKAPFSLCPAQPEHFCVRLWPNRGLFLQHFKKFCDWEGQYLLTSWEWDKKVKKVKQKTAMFMEIHKFIALIPEANQRNIAKKAA